MKNRYSVVLALILGIYFSAFIKVQPQVFRSSRAESSVSALGNNKWKIRLSPKDEWFDTNINVVRGATINIFATGIVNWGPPPGDENTPFRVGPNGTRPPYEDDKHRFPMPDAGCGSLIMRVGDSIYSAGERRSIKIDESGTIQLMVNDDFLSDNSGSFSVDIELLRDSLTALIPLDTDDDTKTPLILIHGIHGTPKGDSVTVKGKYWQKFIDEFKGDNQAKSKYVIYLFQYKSDVDYIQTISHELGRALDRSKMLNRPYVILAHSMGGLVAKHFMTSYTHNAGTWRRKTGGETVLGLITLATPHHGTPGANDTNALLKHFPKNFIERAINIEPKTWKLCFSSVNFTYWYLGSGWNFGLELGFLSPPAVSSDSANRSDLRWDNFDNRINSDVNTELQNTNQSFVKYNHKVILYAGALLPQKPRITDLSEIILAKFSGAITDWEKIRTKYPWLKETLENPHKQLSFADGMLYYGLGGAFGNTDGLAPYQSALLCDGGSYLYPKTPPNFQCVSKYKARRFEPGKADALSNELPDSNTVSIERIPRGYDHKDMYEHPDVLHHVIFDLKEFVSSPKTQLPMSNPLNLIVRISPNYTLMLNNEEVESYSSLSGRLLEIFDQRKKNLVFREGTNEVEKTVWVVIPSDSRNESTTEIIKVIELAGASPIKTLTEKEYEELLYKKSVVNKK